MSDWIDPDDAPMLTADFFARAEIRENGRLIRPANGTLTRPGRPPVGDAPKQQVSLRLDREVVAWFRAQGAGWQTRMNEALRQKAGL
ncbi:BrnA antitoxin family protein [Sandaracinobacteroides saxicola]|uniref:BrnA antitoxin family protein n=1 Tax=Sandaracinobacteroides saxicola TaxID=2759707 RepID=UPI001FB0CCE7|nr:BrnA antitoxin family protein [Sandaracinobacteroides saxicola]